MTVKDSPRGRGTRAAGLAVLAALAALGGWLNRSTGQPPAAGSPGAAPAATDKADRAADRAAVEKAVADFVAAFRKGDAKAVAGSFTADGEYVDDQGATVTGRATLEGAYAKSFAAQPANDLTVEVDGVRLPSRDTAVVEGHFTVRRGKGERVVSRCSLLLAREDGRWHIAILREWPGDGTSLRDLAWLIGSWESKRDGVTVRTKYEWTENHAFIRCRFTVAGGGLTEGGTQMIGKDPMSGRLRAWTFEDAGGIGEADIARDGKGWAFTSTGATADGREVDATNVLTPAGDDAFLWQSVSRSVGGDALPDLPPVKVTRVQP